MKNQKGFIQIPVLIAIIAGVLVLSGVSYVGVVKYKESGGLNDIKIEQTRETELEYLRNELEELKKKTAIQNIPASKNNKQSVSIKGVRLTNAEIIKKVKPAIVFIETKNGVGSGIIVEGVGYILTNAHVVSGVFSAEIKLSDARSFQATVIGRDENNDIAILKINESNLPSVNFGNSDIVEQGDEVFTLGYPFGLQGDVSFKEGTISRRLTEGGVTYLETSAEIHPGNSGGPLVNNHGEVIGVNTAMLGKSIKGISFGETIKLAIPINSIKELLDKLKAGVQIVKPISSEQETVQSQPTKKQLTKNQVVLLRDFLKEFSKIMNDRKAGQRALADSIDSSSLENYDDAFKIAENEFILFSSAYVSAKALLNNLSNEMPFYDLHKSMMTTLVAELMNLKNSAEFRKTFLNAKLYGDFNRAYYAKLEENQAIQKANILTDSLNTKVEEISGILNGYEY